MLSEFLKTYPQLADLGLNNEQLHQLKSAIFCSDFCTRQILSQPSMVLDWFNYQNSSLENLSKQFSASLNNELALIEMDDFMAKIRQFRNTKLAYFSFLLTNKITSVEQNLLDLSNLADALISVSYQYVYTNLSLKFGEPCGVNGEILQLLILGMGKLGGRELNFSSDVDLIFCYPSGGETCIERVGNRSIENHKFFTRVAQNLIQILDEITPHGFVYRIDMRLRPFGDAGDLVMSFSALEDYYQDQGREWERYAMLKCRLINPQAKPWLGEIRQILNPFVYRKYLDFSVIASLRDMKHKIQMQERRFIIQENIKLGLGGIREIEFITQALQIMRGGQIRSLQTSSIFTALFELKTHKSLAAKEYTDLLEAYLFLRQTENILQAINNEQTQNLPENQLDRKRLCEALGYLEWNNFYQDLANHRDKVHKIFSDFIGEEDTTQTTESQFSELQIGMNLEEIKLLFPCMDEALSTQIYKFLADLNSRNIGQRGRSVLGKLLPIIFEEFFKLNDFMLVSENCEKSVAVTNKNTNIMADILDIIKKISSRTTYLDLLLEKKIIITNLVKLASRSKMIAQRLARHPILLDELLDLDHFKLAASLDYYQAALREFMLRIDEQDEELYLNQLRIFKQSIELKIASLDVLGKLPLMRVSDNLSWLAQALIENVVEFAWKKLRSRYGVPDHLNDNEGAKDKQFLVLAYGKLGGIELGYGSDLDLVFLYQAPLDGQTNGETLGKRAIDSNKFYLRLVQKIINIFSLNTGFGVLYEIDTRLRPSGEAGLLVSDFNSFNQYQHNLAWTWEHQSLVRARAIVGDITLQQKFNVLRAEVLSASSLTKMDSLALDISQMRNKIHTENSGNNIKYSAGGIIDVEFIAQYLVLANSHKYSQMYEFSDNIRIFDAALKLELISQAEHQILIDTYLELRQLNHLNTLLNADAGDIEIGDNTLTKMQQVDKIYHRIFN